MISLSIESESEYCQNRETPDDKPMHDTDQPSHSAWSVFLIFLRLGCTSFGGPVAHLGYFREEFVTRRAWLREQAYADLVALCQFLPGPASSQVGLAIGLQRAGYRGAVAAWLGFTLPSALLLVLFALGAGTLIDASAGGLTTGGSLAGALAGLKIVAVAVVAQAVWGMARSLCPDRPRLAIMTASACAMLLAPTPWLSLGLIGAAGLIGLRLPRPNASTVGEAIALPVSRRAALSFLAIFFALLLMLPLLAATGSALWQSIDAFLRAGSLVFGGGHVVLPLLRAEVVAPGWLDDELFLAGYGAAQAVPGPLFTFAAYLGAAMGRAGGHLAALGPWLAALVCLLAIFVPAFLLVAGTLPFWEQLRRNARAQATLAGINAAVVGLLLAALYDPVWTSAIHGPRDFALALLALMALMIARLPPWLVVIACAGLGALAG
jgi:chromate transporter